MPASFKRSAASISFRRRFFSSGRRRLYVLTAFILLLFFVVFAYLSLEARKRPYTMQMIELHMVETTKETISQLLKEYFEENPLSYKALCLTLDEGSARYSALDTPALLRIKTEITEKLRNTLPKAATVKIPLFSNGIFSGAFDSFCSFPVRYTETHTVCGEIESALVREEAGSYYCIYLSLKVDSLVFCGKQWEHVVTEEKVLLTEMLWEKTLFSD